MSSLLPIEAPPEVCGTRHASKLLGLSVGTVQALVEKGELRAWKTKGGHRRIYISSVREFRQASELKATTLPAPSYVRLLVVDDDPVFLTLVKQASTTWQTGTDCVVMDSPIEALMSISTLKPKILLTDLHMPKVDGFELVKQLRANEQFDQMHIVVVTAMNSENIHQHGSFPPGVLLKEKPLEMQWLHGYISALGSSAMAD